MVRPDADVVNDEVKGLGPGAEDVFVRSRGGLHEDGAVADGKIGGAGRLKENLAGVLFEVAVGDVDASAIELDGGAVVIEAGALDQPLEVTVIFDAVVGVIEDSGICDADGFARVRQAWRHVECDIIGEDRTSDNFVNIRVISPLDAVMECGDADADEMDVIGEGVVWGERAVGIAA